MSPLLSSRFLYISISRQVSPSPSLLSSLLAGPLPHCYAWRVGPEKFPRRSPNFLLPAKARVGGRRSREPRRRGAPGGWLARHQPTATGTLGDQLGSGRPGKPQLSAAASPKARGQRERTKRLCRAPGRGEQPLAMLLSSRGRASAQRAPNQPTLCTASRQPALRLCARTSWAQNCPRHSSAKGSSRRPPAGSRLDGHRSHELEATRNPERVTAVKEATRPRRSDALSERAPSRSQGQPASIQPQGPGLQPHSSAELGLASK